MNYNSHELAWAAGFFDGEGCTDYRLKGQHIGRRYKKGVKRNGSRGGSGITPSMILTVSQSELSTLIRFVNAVGYGNINGPYKSVEGCKDRYAVNEQKFEYLQMIIILLWKYLSKPKKEQYKTECGEYLKFISERRSNG